MNSSQIEAILRRFESPDETRVMEKGKFEVVRIGSLTVGRATYEPGWRWSEHVGPTVGAKRCTVAHVGLVLSGTATAALIGLQDRVYERLWPLPSRPVPDSTISESGVGSASLNFAVERTAGSPSLAAAAHRERWGSHSVA